MTTKHSSTPSPTDPRPLWRQVADTRRDAFVVGLASVVIAGGAGALAWLLVTPYPLLLWVVALVAGVYARHLDGYAQRAAEALPVKPIRSQPRWFMRLYWWLARKQVQRAARPKPWRGVKVDGVEDAVKLSRQPNEMRAEPEHAIVAGLTPSDLRKIADEALQLRTLSERAWRLDEYRRVLPSGQVLTRGMFRKTQVWFVDHGLAVKEPYYRITVSLDEVDKVLDNVK